MTNSNATRTVDEIIDNLQVACSRASESVALMHAVVVTPSGHESAIGTAYCVGKGGLFLTALHVVQGLIDGFISLDKTYAIRLVSVDPTNDLALVQVVSAHGQFLPVKFARAIEPEAIVGGIGFPDHGLSVEMSSYLARYQGPVVHGIGPNGLVLQNHRLETALSFVGGDGHYRGYSGGPLVNEVGEVVASTIEADDELGFIIGPSASTILPFLAPHTR